MNFVHSKRKVRPMTKLKTHLFICSNGPDRAEKCGGKNSEELRQKLKALCKTESFAGEIRVNSAGCLGQCEHGIASVFYPQAEWNLNLKSTDVDFMMKKIRKNIEQ